VGGINADLIQVGEQIDGPLSLQRTRSFMADLANMDLFDQITGLVIGRPFAYDETMREEFGKMVLDQCYGTDFPILTNVDVGHTDPILTIPLNAMCSLDSETDSWEILEPGVTS
jgi:muramoyltetrapeptide carboxypeptidase